jgi:hypothetical protein
MLGFTAENGEVYDDNYADEIYEQQRMEVEWDTIWDERYLTTPVALGREIGKWERKFE